MKRALVILAFAILALIALAYFCQDTYAQAGPLTVTTTLSSTKVKVGQTVTITSKLTNSQIPRIPISISGDVSWIGADGIIGTTTTIATIQVTQPVVISGVKITLPLGCSYVNSSATLNGLAVIPTLALGVLSIPVSLTLNESEFASIIYGVKID